MFWRFWKWGMCESSQIIYAVIITSLLDIKTFIVLLCLRQIFTTNGRYICVMMIKTEQTKYFTIILYLKS